VYRVVHVRDLAKGAAGVDTARSDMTPVLPRAAQMVTLVLDAGVVITLRASGTEPKLKYYVEAFGPDPAEVKRAVVLGIHLPADGDLEHLQAGVHSEHGLPPQPEVAVFQGRPETRQQAVHCGPCG